MCDSNLGRQQIPTKLVKCVQGFNAPITFNDSSNLDYTLPSFHNCDFRTTTKGRAGEQIAITGPLSGHPSKQQTRSTLLDLVILQCPLYPLHYRKDIQKNTLRLYVRET
ncbi:hypothetical protein J6590_092009 [Homalodisca vitripennis]|nr:hypothetical protein J6590_092009 [Homalodisca vitripennis]